MGLKTGTFEESKIAHSLSDIVIKRVPAHQENALLEGLLNIHPTTPFQVSLIPSISHVGLK